MEDDIAAIRSAVKSLVDQGRELVLVLHSGGGFLGSNAIEGLTLPPREKEGLAGGVKKIVFIAGAVFVEGFEHKPLPFFKIEVRSPSDRD